MFTLWDDESISQTTRNRFIIFLSISAVPLPPRQGQKKRKVENKCMFKNYFRKTVCFLINDRCVIDAYARFI